MPTTQYVVVEGTKVVLTQVTLAEYPNAIEAPIDIIYNDNYYGNGNWDRSAYRTDMTLPPKLRRLGDYHNRFLTLDNKFLIIWDGEPHTVQHAEELFNYYFAESSPKAFMLAKLIRPAKEIIRQIHPDTV